MTQRGAVAIPALEWRLPVETSLTYRSKTLKSRVHEGANRTVAATDGLPHSL